MSNKMVTFKFPLVLVIEESFQPQQEWLHWNSKSKSQN